MEHNHAYPRVHISNGLSEELTIEHVGNLIRRELTTMFANAKR